MKEWYEMKYKEYEGKIEDLVQSKLKEIENKEQVKILYAVESGSRAWGFASSDSDYDVRFIYIRPKIEYLKLEDKKDFIDWELNEILDINGWDLSKALKHFHKSNASLFEWANSPLIYYSTPEWTEVIQTVNPYFSVKASIYHYYGTAKSNYQAYFSENRIKYKKYFYVLRPLLCCKWIKEKSCPPPVLFETLLEEETNEELKTLIRELIERKKQMSEKEDGERIDKLDEYIKDNLSYYKEWLEEQKDDRNPDWKPLNALFLKMLS